MLEKLKVWNRERRERAAERKAAHLPDPPGVTVPEWLVRATKFASWVATLALIYFLFLYTLDIARDRAGELRLTHVGGWVGELSFWFPYIIGFAIVAFGIPYVAKIAIPTFMSLSWRGNFWPKLWALVIALSVSLVVIAGTFAVQGDTLMERDRDAAVAVAGVEQEAAVLAARIADKRAELDDMVNNASVYVRTAASMSPAAYDVFVQERRDDWQYDRLRSYRATSVDAQRLRDEIAELRAQQARQTTVVSVQGEVTTARTSWIASTLGWLEGVRAILLSLVMDIVALMMPWIALRLEQARNMQLGVSGGIAPHPYMLEDRRDEAPIVDLSPRDAAKAVFDAGGTREEAEEAARAAAQTKTKQRRYEDETGADVTDYVTRGGKMVAMPKRGADGRFRASVEVPPGPQQPDERGVDLDGGQRQASVTAQDEPVTVEAAEVEHSEPSEEEAQAWLDALVEAPIEAPDQQQQDGDETAPDHQSEHVTLPNEEGVMVADNEDEGQQQDAHVQARAMLPAA